jgi:sirohydrochlorin cobaltochelatase
MISLDMISLESGRGVLVVGHGTANRGGADETRCLAGLVADQLPGVPVELGFLEVIGPTIAEAVGRLAARGVREVVAAPLLLFTAGHARRDVPEAVTAAAATHDIRVRQSESLGMHPDLVALARRRRQEAVGDLPHVPAAETALVVMGRGASDPTAPGQLREFVEATLAAEATRPAHVLQGFAAAARPTLDEAVAMAASLPGVRRVVVQPHLLFQGHVLDQVATAVATARRARPELEWIEVGRLGTDPLVARSVVDRVAEAAAGFRDVGAVCGP